jgi:hypothetical protein
LKAPISVPKKRPFQEKQYDKFLADDTIKNFSDVDQTLTPLRYTFNRYDDHVVYFRLETNELSVPEVAGCIRVDRDSTL